MIIDVREAGEMTTKKVKLNELVENHNPVNPREIVVPMHNEDARYVFRLFRFAKLEIFFLWALFLLGISLFGFVLSVLIFLKQFDWV